MLSILIPVYNYDITALVAKLISQLHNEEIDCEIIVADDCSTDKKISKKNEFFLSEQNIAKFLPLAENIGRSAIRNLLAKEALYENLLFLDADVIPKYDSFILNYIKLLNTDYKIICGGIVYQEIKPEKEQLLRWIYGNARESIGVDERVKKPYVSFLTSNFLIKKLVLKTIKFDEKIKNIGFEDLLFSLEAKKNNINILHISNSIIHNGLETSEIFLQKSLEAVSAKINFIEKGILEEDYTKLSKIVSYSKKIKIEFFLNIFFKSTRKFFEKNLLSSKPSMFYFDLYRLGYYYSFIQ